MLWWTLPEGNQGCLQFLVSMSWSESSPSDPGQRGAWASSDHAPAAAPLRERPPPSGHMLVPFPCPPGSRPSVERRCTSEKGSAWSSILPLTTLTMSSGRSCPAFACEGGAERVWRHRREKGLVHSTRGKWGMGSDSRPRRESWHKGQWPSPGWESA